MHQHFAQHVLSGCFYTLFKLNTVSFHLGKESSTVDIQGILTEDQIRKFPADLFRGLYACLTVMMLVSRRYWYTSILRKTKIWKTSRIMFSGLWFLMKYIELS